MIGNAVDAISKNGVVMVNVVLRGDGTLPENQAAYLTAFFGGLITIKTLAIGGLLTEEINHLSLLGSHEDFLFRSAHHPFQRKRRCQSGEGHARPT